MIDNTADADADGDDDDADGDDDDDVLLAVSVVAAEHSSRIAIAPKANPGNSLSCRTFN